MLQAHLLHATLNFTVLHCDMFMSPVVERTEYLLVQSDWEGTEMYLLALSCLSICTYITNKWTDFHEIQYCGVLL